MTTDHKNCFMLDAGFQSVHHTHLGRTLMEGKTIVDLQELFMQATSGVSTFSREVSIIIQ